MKHQYKTSFHPIVAALLLLGLSFSCQFATEKTRIYLVRHAETHENHPDKMLTEAGLARAVALVKRFEGVKLTHVFASHTLRARDTVTPLAKAHDLEVQQFPLLGSTVEGKVIDNRTSSTVAIRPLLKALQEVAKGSAVVVGGNSSNLYSIMEGLGVRIATKDNLCRKDEKSCLGCSDRSCFPGKEFNNLWLVVPAAKPRAKATMYRSTYGDQG